MEADGHPDWRLEPASPWPPYRLRKGGDLARMLGVRDSVSEEAEDLNAARAARRSPSQRSRRRTIVQSSGKPGPTIMIIGNSFTTIDFAHMLLQHAGRVVSTTTTAVSTGR